MMAHLLQLLLTSVVILQVVFFQQCCDATEVPVVVTSVSRGVASKVRDIAVDRDNNFLYVSGGFCVYRLASNGTSAQVIAGSSTAGTADGVGGAARFTRLFGITCDTANNIAYICDYDNNRIRTLDLTNNNVTTLAGSSVGTNDGIGVAAQFYSPNGIVHYTSRIDGMVLFVTDFDSKRIRRIVVASANVTTIAQTTYSCYYLCISRDGSSLFLGSQYTVVRINMSTKAIVTLAGGPSTGSRDGTGTSARFNRALGIALNDNETALFVVDWGNFLVRRLELSSNNVSTIAGNTTRGLVDGPGLAARFYSPWGGKWYCNKMSSRCGLLVADNDNAAIRFVAIERNDTRTAEPSNEATLSASVLVSPSRTILISASDSQSLSVTSSSSKATKSASSTRHTPSPTVTMYCALVPADGTNTVGRLQRFNSAAVVSVPIVGTVPMSTFVSEAPISRAALLQNLPLGMNLSVSLAGTIRGGPADGWALVSATMNVVAANSVVPLVTAGMPLTLLSANVVARQQSFAVVLRQKKNPSSLNTFRAVSLVVTLVLRCPTDHTISADVAVEIPCPGQEQPLAEEVKAAGTAALYSTSIAGLAGGGAVGRVAAVRSLVLCSSDTVIEGVAPLSIVACDKTNAASADARGAIAGNLACWAGACVLMVVVVAAYAHLAHVPLRRATEAFGAPSPLLPLAIVTVPSTVSGTFYLLRDVQCALDGVIAVIGVLMCACPVVVLCWVAYMAPRRLVRVDSLQHASSSRTFNTCIPPALRTPIAALFHRRVRWIDVSVERACGVDVCRENSDSKVNTLEADSGTQRSPSPSWRRLATVILIDYALVWYVCVDVTVLTAAGFLGAVSSLGSGSACRASAVVVLVLYLGQLVLCAVVRPFTTLFSNVYALFTLALSTLAVACQVWYLFGSVIDGVDLIALSQFLTAAAVCDIMVAAVSMLKSLVDVVDVLRVCRRHVKVMFPMMFGESPSFAQLTQPKPLFEDTLSGAENEPSAPMHETCEPHEREAEDFDIATLMDSMFSPTNSAPHDDTIGDNGTILTAWETAHRAHHHNGNDLLHFYSQASANKR
ncbi:membrane-associated protein, putative [Bodo saltans]|uniref:Membrane-associated protein, putative n=1 Tax=Bodo saltans TaxID=75058 RepID=A0A0S4JEM6_BODSA|nr:membrane-associated protein, putative [Bodo saltans]|eukprot:CUG88630.1 membrane-associated protein, putative [Bodo saltans]